MAMIVCGECKANISSNAASCPRCGNPVTLPKEELTKSKTKENKINPFLVFLILLAVFLVAIIGGNWPTDAKMSADADQRREECVKALMSNMGHSTVGYADQQAYSSHVASECDGLTVSK